MSAPARLPSALSQPHRTLLRWALALLAGLLLALAAAPAARAQATAVPASILGDPVQQVGLGGRQTCALTAAGAVYCWGEGYDGMLGNGGTANADTPQPVTGLGSGVAAIAVGEVSTCALTTAGAVKCWGNNMYGSLGDGSTTHASTPQQVSGLSSGVAAISAGAAHSCALTTAGAMLCWGFNTSGQVGNGGTANVLTPQPVTGLSSGVAAMALGAGHTCVVTTAGAARCWGLNNSGQLGTGSTTDASTPQPVTGLASGVAAISAKGALTCAVTTAGAARCWGLNYAGQLGNGSTTDASTPQPVTGLSSGVAAISAGGAHACALSTAGAVQCWGRNHHGQLGNGNPMYATTPQPVTGLPGGMAAIGTGAAHSCAVTTAGALQCWGINSYGELGIGSSTPSSIHTPQHVLRLGGALGSAATSIAGGASHTCAVSAAGQVLCWGRNDNAQLGKGDVITATLPHPVTGLYSGYTSVATGEVHSCALASDGSVQCWGDNGSGQLGDGTTTGALTPTAVTNLPGAAQAIVAGALHTCALMASNGAVLCWGDNTQGQLGNGNNTSATTPQPVQGLASGAKAIAAGATHTCAIDSADALVCWGSNASGQLGNGTSVHANTPQAVTGLAGGVAAVTAGREHSCALTSTGVLKCWGANASGQLGDNSQTAADTPQDVVSPPSGVAAIGAGRDFTCARTSAGALWCWGDNSTGQLGNGGTANTNTPQAVVSLGNGVETFTTGHGHACAITTVGGRGLQCWGDNQFRQLGNGNGSATQRLVATPTAQGQTIDFPVLSPPPAQGSATNLVATASSGLAVEFESWTPDVCTLAGGQLQVQPGKTGHWCGVRARQSGGTGVQEAGFVTARPQTQLLLVHSGLPDAPTAVAANPGDTTVTVRWTAPAYDGSYALTGYTVTTVENTAKTCSVTTGSPLPTTCTVTGLTNGTPYTFTVRATNVVGNSLESAPTSPAVRPAEAPAGGGGPATLTIKSSGTTTITDPTQPNTLGPNAAGATLVLPGSGTAPVTLQLAVNGQSLQVTALPGTQLQLTRVNGQAVLVLVVLQGSASMASTVAGQPMALAGEVLLSSGAAGTRIDAQPLAVAVVSGSLVPPSGSLPELGGKGLQAGERLQVDTTGKVVAITLGSIKGDGTQPGDAMTFANLPASVTVDGKAFARMAGAVPRLSGADLTQGLEVAPSGVLLLRDGGQVYQLLPTHPITIDARLPDGVSFTPLGLLRWVRGGVVVQFAPAVADLAGLASAVTAVLADAKLKLGAEGVIQLTTGGVTYVLKPDWTGAGAATGTPSIGVDAQGRIYLQIGTGARQLLLPALLSPMQAQALFTSALPGAALAVKSGASDGSLTLTLGGAQWRLVPQWVLPGNDAAQTTPWRMGADGVLYLQLGTQVQGLKIED